MIVVDEETTLDAPPCFGMISVHHPEGPTCQRCPVEGDCRARVLRQLSDLARDGEMAVEILKRDYPGEFAD